MFFNLNLKHLKQEFAATCTRYENVTEFESNEMKYFQEHAKVRGRVAMMLRKTRFAKEFFLYSEPLPWHRRLQSLLVCVCIFNKAFSNGMFQKVYDFFPLLVLARLRKRLDGKAFELHDLPAAQKYFH